MVTAAVAAGWSVEQIRAELHGADVGATSPAAVVVSRLRALLDRNPPAPVVDEPTAGDFQRMMDAGQVCDHGNPDARTAAGVHRCPICRKSEAGRAAVAG